jgi:Ni/Co efflux regulator RcnB
MKSIVIAISAAAFIVAAPAAFAAGVSSNTPGHEMMHTKSSKKLHHGASGYTPGHQAQAKGSKTGHPGASGYAPGQTTGSSSTKGSY